MDPCSGITNDLEWAECKRRQYEAEQATEARDFCLWMLLSDVSGFLAEYGSIDLSFDIGAGPGISGQISITSEGISGYIGVGLGLGAGVSVTGGLAAGDASGPTVSGSVTGGAGPGGTAGGGVSEGGGFGGGGVGFGLGAGATITGGLSFPILSW